MITFRPSGFVKVPYNDPRFIMNDGLVQCNVAGIEVTDECPAQYQRIIAEAFYNGWLIPYAMIKQELDYSI